MALQTLSCPECGADVKTSAPDRGTSGAADPPSDGTANPVTVLWRPDEPSDTPTPKAEPKDPPAPPEPDFALDQGRPFLAFDARGHTAPPRAALFTPDGK